MMQTETEVPPLVLCGTCSDLHHCEQATKRAMDLDLACQMYHPWAAQIPLEGRKDDTGKPRFELLAPEALEGTARILTFGAKKYTDRNWEKGMKWSRVFGALMRHLWCWWRGEEVDSETGESHLHHAACCIMFLQAYEVRRVGEDDRARRSYD